MDMSLVIRSGRNRLAKHSEREKKKRQTEKKKEVGKQHQGIDRPGGHQVPEGYGEQRKMEETGCEIIRGAPTAPDVKEYVKVNFLASVYVACFFLVRRFLFEMQ